MVEVKKHRYLRYFRVLPCLKLQLAIDYLHFQTTEIYKQNPFLDLVLCGLLISVIHSIVASNIHLLELQQYSLIR